MTVIIGLSGKKQSGKSTMANFMHGYEMKLAGVIEKFDITDKGELLVNCHYEQNGAIVQDMGVLDLNQKNDTFYEYASNRIWPLIKLYSFADPLKELVMSLFELPYESVYGTDQEKNEVTHIMWENCPGVKNKKGPMTGREIMQFVGTEVFRKMYEPVWINATLNMIEAESPPIAVICDVRFKNEADSIRAKGGKVVRNTRTVSSDFHNSEVDLDDYEYFDLLIDNAKLTIAEANKVLLDNLVDWGVTRKVYVPKINEKFTSISMKDR